MTWAAGGTIAGSIVAGLVIGAALGLLLVRVRLQRRSAGAGSGLPGGRSTAAPGSADATTRIARKGLDSLRVGVVVLDPADRPIVTNPAARAMGLLRAGAERGSVVAHPAIRSLADQVRHYGVRREAQLDLPRGGSMDPLGVRLRGVALGADHIAVEASDMTEAQRVARVRRDFVSNVSHELKTPIGAMQLLAEALLDATGSTGPGAGDTDPTEDVAAARRFAERIHHESTRLGRLVNELLELSRLQGAEPLPAPEPVAVDWVVADAVDRTRTGAAAKRIEVAVDGRAGLTVYGSDAQLATALANLVENAVAYSAEGRTVRITTGSAEDFVEIAVTDEGIGIDPTEVDRIFERFYRADQARSRLTGGTGLGLAIVKHIAANHGGGVDVSSTLGEGSTFTLRLPARPREAILPLPDPVEIEPG